MTKTVVEAKQPAGAETYEALLEAAESGQKDDPAWLTARRAAARESFRNHGIPHPKLEAFRETNLGPIRTAAWSVPTEPGKVQEKEVAPYRIPEAIAEIVLVDGVVVPRLCRLPDDGAVTFAPLGPLLEDAPASVEQHLAQVVAHTGPEETLRALNTALFTDGAYLQVPKGVVLERPVHVLHVAARHDAPTSLHPRILADIGEAAQATLVETYAGLGGETWTNAVTELVLGPAAILDHVKIQNEPLTTHHSMAAGARVARGAKLRDLSVALGAKLSRSDISARLAEGAEVEMNGLFFGRADQHVDHHTWIDHAEPHGTSIERYKGILDGASHGVFTGNILVRPGAQKTNSDQENRNLILSKKALIDTTPQLEIHADDVKCAHGSTIGRLPEQQIFYLRSRGFSEEDAKRMLTEAFAAEVLEILPDGPLRERLERHVGTWFSLRKEEA